LWRGFAAMRSSETFERHPEPHVQVGPTRYRVPDVVVLDRAPPIEQVVTRAPHAVSEILSPQDTMPRVLHKPGEYAAMGIAQIWVIDPKRTQFYRYAGGSLECAEMFGSPGEQTRFLCRKQPRSSIDSGLSGHRSPQPVNSSFCVWAME
jgi:hypothetical protein